MSTPKCENFRYFIACDIYDPSGRGWKVIQVGETDHDTVGNFSKKTEAEEYMLQCQRGIVQPKSIYTN